MVFILFINQFTDLIKLLSNPILILIGISLLVFVIIIKNIINLKIFTILREKNTFKIFNKVLSYLFIIVIIIVVLGFATFILDKLSINDLSKKPNIEIIPINKDTTQDRSIKWNYYLLFFYLLI